MLFGLATLTAQQIELKSTYLYVEAERAVLVQRRALQVDNDELALRPARLLRLQSLLLLTALLAIVL